ncbi:hypothetical protein [Streptomyces botrytidirepellens]|uniref:Uncharacterized protein n=1 Tax=Streptomyces botrytidirepellens TaxID=2486417 RepID=A0A3M8WK61_9ACTN|nr:hypothetical protein [Streptomyces botrytidirepellens]RNG30452.1 hypothetical protein EEJ42_10510 [Streptomyces botrytidirepellens]
MSDPSAAADTRELAVLRDFYCEHTSTKSRVLALVAHADGPPSLKAVLTCRDVEHAQLAAEILRSVLACGAPLAPELKTQADTLAMEMPDAVTASFREAIEAARTGGWLVEKEQLSYWPDEETQAAVDRWRTRLEDNNLSRLSAPVIRHVYFTEYQVTDTVAFFNSATSMGWQPAGPFPLDLSDPLHAMEATIHLTAPSLDLPGAQVLSTGSSVRVLDPEQGDELADWSPEGFSADFGPGVRYEEDPTGPGMSEQEWERINPLPDFATLFSVQRGSDEWQFTPRTAYILHTALGVLGDEGHEAARAFADETLTEEDEDHATVFTELPEATWSQNFAWRRQFARAANDLAQDIAVGQRPVPRCVAERVALDCALDEAREQAKAFARITPSYDRLPRHRDDAWERVEDALLDSGEPSDDGLPPFWGTAPEQWFEPFPDTAPRAVDRGYPPRWEATPTSED